MAFNIQDLNKVDDDNQQNWPEGTQKVKDVNNAGRADEGMLARWFADYNGSKTTTGTASALVVDLDTAPTAYYNGLTVVARVHRDVAADATLNAGGLGAAPIKKNGGKDLKEGDLVSQTVGVFVSDGTNWTLTSVAIPNIGTEVGDLIVLEDVDGSAGLPAVDGSQLTGVVTGSDFGCVLVRKDANTLELRPTYPGAGVWVAGQFYSLETPYLTLNAWEANTVYQVYVKRVGDTLELEANATGWVISSLYYYLVQQGSSGRTAVGAARTNASSQFVDSETSRGVRSVYNEKNIEYWNAVISAQTFAASSPTNVPNLSAQVLVLPEERVIARCGGQIKPETNGAKIALWPWSDVGGDLNGGGEMGQTSSDLRDNISAEGIYHNTSNSAQWHTMYARAAATAGSVTYASKEVTYLTTQARGYLSGEIRKRGRGE